MITIGNISIRNIAGGRAEIKNGRRVLYLPRGSSQLKDFTDNQDNEDARRQFNNLINALGAPYGRE